MLCCPQTKTQNVDPVPDSNRMGGARSRLIEVPNLTSPASDRSQRSCFSEVLQECLTRHPGIRRAFVLHDHSFSSLDSDRLIVDGLMALAACAPFSARDFIFIDRSTEAGTLRRRLPLIRAICTHIRFPISNLIYVSQSSLRVVPTDQPIDAAMAMPGWVFFHSCCVKFARAHRNRDPGTSLADSTDQVLCMNNKIRPQRIAVALSARRICQERLILSWRGDAGLYSGAQATEEFRREFPSLAGEAVELQESALAGDPDLGDIYGLPAGPAAASFLHIVTESDYLPWSDRFTEKLLKPVAASRPFLVFGPPGVLKTFRSIGFQTFADIFDESYDQIENPEQRLAAMLRTLDELMRRDYRETLQRSAEVCAHNRDFLRFRLEDRLVGMLDQRLGELAGLREQHRVSDGLN